MEETNRKPGYQRETKPGYQMGIKPEKTAAKNAELEKASGCETGTARIHAILSRMSLRQKITQMLMVDFRYWEEPKPVNAAQGQKIPVTVLNDPIRSLLESYQFGAMIYFAQNLEDTLQSRQLSEDVQWAAMAKGGLPMLICADQEGGMVYRLASGTAMPGNMALGAIGDLEQAKEAGALIGRELLAVGINTNLAPVADINNNANNPVIGLRSFGDDPEAVGKLTCAMAEGLEMAGVIACAKHFPGHGDTDIDSHYGLPVVNRSEEELEANEFVPFRMAVKQGIDMIMTAHILYPKLDDTRVYSEKTGKQEALPATMSKKILTDLLRKKMGFQGVIVTDAMNMAGVAGTYNQVQSIILAVMAGADLICMPCVLEKDEDARSLDAIIEGLEAAVMDGRLDEEQLDQSVRRILMLKEKAGLLDAWDRDPDGTGLKMWDGKTDCSCLSRLVPSAEQALAIVGSKENRELERKLAADAVTLIRNREQTIPLSVSEIEMVLMLCPYQNEEAQMAMGWNRAKAAGRIPESAGIEIFRFSEETMKNTGTLEALLARADAVIVSSELSTAEHMAYRSWLSAVPQFAVTYCRQHGKKSIVMSVNRPYDVQLYPDADAVLAVYGCRGSSVDVTEALVGGATGGQAAYGPNIIAGIEVILGVCEPKGTLPVDIPAFDPDAGCYTEQIVYPRGYSGQADIRN